MLLYVELPSLLIARATDATTTPTIVTKDRLHVHCWSRQSILDRKEYLVMGCTGSKAVTAVPAWTVPYDKVQRFQKKPKKDCQFNSSELVNSNFENVRQSPPVSPISIINSCTIPIAVHGNKEKRITKEKSKPGVSCAFNSKESSVDCVKKPLNKAKLTDFEPADSNIDNDQNSSLDLKNTAQQSQSPNVKISVSHVSIPLIPLIISIPAPLYKRNCTEITKEEKIVVPSYQKVKSPVSKKVSESKKKCEPLVEERIVKAIARNKRNRERNEFKHGISPCEKRRTMSEENLEAKANNRGSNEEKEENEEEEKKSLNIIANRIYPISFESGIQEHCSFYSKIHGLDDFDSVRKKVAVLLRDGNISNRKNLVSSNDFSEPTHDYLLRKRVLSKPLEVDHTLECQVISHCIMQTKEIHNILKEIDLSLSRTKQSFVVQGLLTPVYDIHNGFDHVARTFNLHLMDENLNQKKGAAVKEFLIGQYKTLSSEKGGEINFQKYFKDASVVKEGLIDSDELVGKMERLLRDVEDPYRNYLTTVRSVLSSKGIAEKRFEALSESVNQVYDKMFDGDRSR